MIVSHRHKFVFLKTRKTAGTSLEIGLSEYCGPDDVITEISPDDEEVRRRLGFRGPQNHVLTQEQISRMYGNGKRNHSFRNHDIAQRVYDGVGTETWNGYFKFTIERNPYDKAISRYYWSMRDVEQPDPIGAFLEKCKPPSLSNWDIYTIADRVAVDYVIRYENLGEEVDRLGQQLGIGRIAMPQSKASHRRDRRHYREILSNSDRLLIEKFCRREIAAFGYEW